MAAFVLSPAGEAENQDYRTECTRPFYTMRTRLSKLEFERGQGVVLCRKHGHVRDSVGERHDDFADTLRRPAAMFT